MAGPAWPLREPARLRIGKAQTVAMYRLSALGFATAGTILHNTKTPLTVWFWAAYLITTDKRDISALLLQRQLALRRYETDLFRPDPNLLELAGAPNVLSTFWSWKRKGLVTQIAGSLLLLVV